jgi:ERCC4-type nuclease
MKIRLLVSVKDGKVWYEPGTILERSSEEASSLIAQKAAEVIGDDPVLNTAEGVVPVKEIGEEDLSEMAEELMKVDGITREIAYRLIEAGFQTVQAVAEARVEDLQEIKGLSKKKIASIQGAAEDLIDSK